MKRQIWLTVIMACWPLAGMAQDCLDYGEFPHLVAQTPTPAIVASIAIADDHAYMGDYSTSNDDHFHVVDISVPGQPVIVGSLGVPVRLNGVAVSGSLVCAVGDSYLPALARMIVFDVEAPDQPAILGSLDLPDVGFGVDLDGSLAYIACKGAGLLVVDVSDPASPVIVGSLPTSDEARGIRVSAGLAYLTVDEAGLLVVDVSDPTAPVVVGNMPVLNRTAEVVLTGPYCLITDATAGIAIVDVSEPTAPVEVGRWIGPDSVRDVAVDQDMAFLVDSDGIFRAIDISIPAEPVLAFSVNFGTFGTSGDLAVAGNHAFLAARSDGLRVVDLGNRSRPALLGSLPAGAIGAACSSSDLAFVTQDTSLMAIDISDPSAPVEVGNVPISGTTALNCAIADDLVLVTRSFFNSPWGPSEAGGLDIFDVSDPADMQLIGTVDIDLNVVGVDVDGDHAYLACTGYSTMPPPGSLTVVDISDPANPWICGSVVISETSDVAVTNGLAVVTDGWSTVYLVDVSDPLAPQLLDMLSTLGTPASSVVISGSLAYVGGGGLAIFQLDGPQAGNLIGSVEAYGGAHRTAVAGDTVYTIGDNTLQIYDATVPEDPVVVGSRLVGSGSLGIAVTEDAVLCGSAAGLDVLALQCAGLSAVAEPGDRDLVRPISGVRIHPNPFNPRTNVSFRTWQPGPVRLAVYDLRGRLVVDLLDRVVPAGDHSIVWTGRDAAGRDVPSGEYIFSVETDGMAATRKAILVR